MTFDLQRARQETPGCEHVLHFNNAGASLMPQPVLDATISHLQLEAQIGGYEAEEQAHDAIEHVYDAAAALAGCSGDEIAIIENATRAWDMAFYSIPFRPGDRILTAVAEYASNYIAYLQVAQKTGASVEAIPNDEHGQISIEALRKAIDERVKLIAITHVPTNGVLVRLEPPFLDLHAATWTARDHYEMLPNARRFENWETNYAGKIGLGVAIDYAMQWGLDTTWRRIKTLAYNLRARLSTLPGAIVRDRGVTQCGIVTFTVDGKDPEEIKQRLAQHAINVTVSERSSTLLDMEERGLDRLVRASVHYYNSEEEIERFWATLVSII